MSAPSVALRIDSPARARRVASALSAKIGSSPGRAVLSGMRWLFTVLGGVVAVTRQIVSDAMPLVSPVVAPVAGARAPAGRAPGAQPAGGPERAASARRARRRTGAAQSARTPRSVASDS